jgi:hypothetical protein
MKVYDARTLLYNYVSDAKMMLDNHQPARKVSEFLRNKIAKLEKPHRKTDWSIVRWDDEKTTEERKERKEGEQEETYE